MRKFCFFLLVLTMAAQAETVDHQAVPLRPTVPFVPSGSAALMGTHWSRGNDDAPENSAKGNFSTANMFSTLVFVRDSQGTTMGELQILALPYNHSIEKGSSQNFCIREIKRWAQEVGKDPIEVEVRENRIYLTGSAWSRLDWKGCVMSLHLDRTSEAVRRAKEGVYYHYLGLGTLPNNALSWGELWIEMGNRAMQPSESESNLRVKHKILWQAETKDGKIVGADVTMENPSGQRKQITDTLRYQGHYQGSGDSLKNIKLESYKVRETAAPFPYKN